MRKLLYFALGLLCPLAIAAGAGSAGSSWDATAIHTAGAQTMVGPLTLTCATCAADGTIALAIPSGSKFCLDGATCAVYAYNDSGGMAVNKFLALNDGSVLAGNLDARGAIFNSSAANGGSVAFSDPIRNLSTTVALFESSTAATAGVDTAFYLNALNTLAAGDKLLEAGNAGAARFYVTGDGSSYFAGPASIETAVYSPAFVARSSSTSATLKGLDNDDASAVGAILDNTPALTTAGAKLVSVRNATVEKANWDKDGMPQIGIGNTSAAPTCDATTRMKMWTIASGAGVKDSVQICTKDASDAYAWRTIY